MANDWILVKDLLDDPMDLTEEIDTEDEEGEMIPCVCGDCVFDKSRFGVVTYKESGVVTDRVTCPNCGRSYRRRDYGD